MGIPADVVSKVSADWGKVGGDLGSLGAILFEKMFTARPNTQDYFAAFKGKSMSELKADPALKTHGAKVLSLVDTMVKNATDEGKLKSAVAEFVKNHKARNVGLDLIAGTKPELIAAIVQAGGANADAWGTFLDAFIGLVKAAS
ncbi:hypothetical protein ScPMuIL_018950 [Solemya velum]